MSGNRRMCGLHADGCLWQEAGGCSHAGSAGLRDEGAVGNYDAIKSRRQGSACGCKPSDYFESVHYHHQCQL